MYRVEQGTPVEGEPGVYALDDFEIATRLSYLVWGTTPSDALLDAAEAGELHTPEQLRDMAQLLLLDPRARAQIDRLRGREPGRALRAARARRRRTRAKPTRAPGVTPSWTRWASGSSATIARAATVRTTTAPRSARLRATAS